MLDLKLEYEYMKTAIDDAMKNCLDHQRWILGPEVKELEESIAAYLGVKHCIGSSSGTEALVLSLRASAIKLKNKEFFDETDKVITTSFTFTATGDAILRSGATPVFVDIDPDTFNIDTGQIREFAESNKGVVGILPVHLYGQPCNMDEIMKIAEEYGLFVIEDVAQAFGGSWKGKKVGSIGTAGAFSFFPAKNLGGFGDGGLVSTNDDQTMELMRMLLKHGGKDKYNVDHIGYNARIDTLQAAIVLAKLKYIDEFNERRRNIAGMYNQNLAEVNGLKLSRNGSRTGLLDGHVYHQYTVRTSKRQEMQTYLKDKGIATMIYYPFPLHKMKVFSGRTILSGPLSHSEAATEEVLSLPMEPLQSDEDTNYITDTINKFFKEK
jgi:dTDP-4-amino-4,6-dideoxygalactose transaminase